MQSWQMQTAKARFSEVVKLAADEGPQEILCMVVRLRW